MSQTPAVICHAGGVLLSSSGRYAALRGARKCRDCGELREMWGLLRLVAAGLALAVFSVSAAADDKPLHGVALVSASPTTPARSPS